MEGDEGKKEGIEEQENKLKKLITDKVEEKVEDENYANDKFEEDTEINNKENNVSNTEVNAVSNTKEESPIFALVRAYKHNTLIKDTWKDYIALDMEAIEYVKTMIGKRTAEEILTYCINDKPVSIEWNGIQLFGENEKKTADRIDIIDRYRTKLNTMIKTSEKKQAEKLRYIMKILSLTDFKRLIKDIDDGYTPMIFYFTQSDSNQTTKYSSFRLANPNSKFVQNSLNEEETMNKLFEKYKNYNIGKTEFVNKSSIYVYSNQNANPVNYIPFGIGTLMYTKLYANSQINLSYKDIDKNSTNTLKPTSGGSSRLYGPIKQRQTGYYNF